MGAIILLTDYYNHYRYNGHADMRRSIDGLSGIVFNQLGKALDHKHVFIFLNKRGTHIKLLLQEADGFTLLYRRLHKGRFILPEVTQGEAAMQISATSLFSMLSGLHLYRVQKTA